MLLVCVWVFESATVLLRAPQVASFYTMFNRERVGKYFIQLCGTTPCMVNGSEEIKAAIEKHLNIKDGGAYSACS